VVIVTIAKRTDTMTAPEKLFLEAGYITNGIRGSQGPKTKIRKSIHGVVLKKNYW
jgi:hypothetical protein